MTKPIELGFRPSPQQQRVWRLQNDGRTSCTSMCALRIEGDLDIRTLRRALEETVVRHEILHTAFRLPAGLIVPLQVILEPGSFHLPIVDLRDLSPEIRSAGTTDLLCTLGRPPFDLEQGEGWRAALVWIGPCKHELLLVLSAACADAGTFEPLAADFLAAYVRQRTGGAEDPEPPLQYADVAEWQNSLLEGEDTKEGVEAWREHWREHEIEARISLPLPLEESEAAPGPFRPRAARIPLGHETAAILARLAEAWDSSLKVLILTAWMAVIQRSTGRDETLVGLLYSGRDTEELQGVIGPLARYLPIAARFSPETPLREAAARIRQAIAEVEPWGDYFSWDHVTGNVAGGFPVCFESVEEDWELVADGLRVSPIRLSSNFVSVIDRFSLALSCYGFCEDLRLSLRYDPRRFRHEAAKRLAGRLASLLGSIAARPEASLADHPVVAEEELGHWLELSVARPAANRDWEGNTCHMVFAKQAKLSPSRLAVAAGDGHLTFHELDVRANRLAHHLRAAGVGPEVPVALCLERSAEAVVALLAIWKAGAAYVPLDPTQPAERLVYLLADTEVPLLVTSAQLASLLPELPGIRTLRLDDEAAEIALQPADPPINEAGPHSLAYLIYTSGSTGRPKGVQVEHRSVLHLLTSLEAAVLKPLAEPGLRPDPLLASLNAPMIFDASVQQLVLLLAGHSICVVPEDIRADGEALLGFLRKQGVDLLDCTPSQLRLLVNAGLLDGAAGPCIVLTAGEAVDELLWRRLAQAERTVCFNLYGPTECSVDATFHRIEPGSTRPTIGRPLAGYEVFLLDRTLQPVPLGAPGELCLGGTGLARGYLRRPDLTAEHFVPHPFARRLGERLYRTGDLGRHLPNRDLEFLGRLDHQVKIRGYRIELGEVEAVLGEQAGVREAVVVARESAAGDLRLVAYVVGDSTVEGVLRQALRERLPDYMVPMSFVRLAALPLTPNGKVNRKALPAPEQHGAREGYMAPRTREEELLAVVWAQVLRLPQVGVNDNFFELGGDSILSVQIVARARQAGLLFTVRQIFEHQTVAGLARHAKAAESTGTPRSRQGPVVGKVPLTPIQRLFFEQGFADPQHFNQALLLESRESLSPAALESAMASIVEHHDALRLRFSFLDGHGAAGGWRQENAAAEPTVPFYHIDLSSLSAPRFREAFERATVALQAGFDLSAGPLTRLSLFETGTHQPQLLLWVTHHLVVDGVSWRVLVEDLEGAYRQAARGLRPTFPPKTTSFQEWAHRLAQHAGSDPLARELNYWCKMAPAKVPRLPVDFPSDADTAIGNLVGDEVSIAFELSAEETSDLLQTVPSVYHSRIDEALLSALVRALTGWTGSPRLRVDLEGHGREPIFDDLDISRTVGWFTALYPVVLEAGDAGPGDALVSAKERLRAVPERGIGYGLLRYLRDAGNGGNGEAPRLLKAVPAAEISFNYLGQVDATSEELSLLRASRASAGPTRSPRAHRTHLLDISGIVANGRLHITLLYGSQTHRRETAVRLAAAYAGALRELIQHSQEGEEVFTLSDFPKAGLDLYSFNRLALLLSDPVKTIAEGMGLTLKNVADIYPLSPLQKGMLFHSLMAPESGVYVGQFTCTLAADLNIRLFRQAWERLIERHEVLRTVFFWDGLDEPRQVVRKNVPLPWQDLDWRGIPAEEQERRFEELRHRDRHTPLPLNKAPLMRFSLIRLDCELGFIWTSHHLLMDGWSLPLLVQELEAVYAALQERREPALPPARPFSDYIVWLLRQDQSQAEPFWRGELAGFTAPNPLGIAHAAGTEGPSGYAEHRIRVSHEVTAELQVLAARHKLTLQTVTLGAWGVLISRYSSDEDVVFGTVVSGRPAALPGIETMIGMLINTLPVRLRVNDTEPLVLWLQRLQERQLARHEFENIPLTQIQRWSEIPAGSPLFETLYVFENYPIVRDGGSGNLRIGNLRTFESTNYPINLILAAADQMILQLTYDRARVDGDAALRLLHHLSNLLTAAVPAPERTIAELPLLSAAELHQTLVEWNDMEVLGAWEGPVPSLVERRSRERPADPAVVDAAGRVLTYGELADRAGRLASFLRALGVGPETLVGVLAERSPELVVGLLGILRAGAAYVPLDPSYPAERLSLMLTETAAPVVLTQEALLGRLPKTRARVVCLDRDWKEIGRLAHVPAMRVEPDGLAYVIYTSGSTGRPKGVQIPHRGLMNLVGWDLRSYGTGPGDRRTQVASLGFDASVWEIWPCLASGAALHLPAEETRLDSQKLAAWMAERGITVSFLPTPLAEALLAAEGTEIPSLRWLLVGGDRLRLYPNSSCGSILVNHYGPTEASVVTSAGAVPSRPVGEAGPAPSLGRPIDGLRVHLLGRSLLPVPVGVPGELFISGVNLARGYVERPDLTAERFLPDPMGSEPGARVYRTGDLARWRTDGAIEFLGRTDHQVKIRGFRIELGEIEAALAAHPRVREAVVVARDDQGTDRRLVAYVVPHGVDEPPASGELRAWLQQRLPGYMVPVAFEFLPKLPLTPNGKLDRRALSVASRRVAEDGYVGPRNPLEEVLTGIWAEILNLERVGVHDNFFAIGGQSLLAVRLIAQMREIFPGEFLLRTLFSAPTVAELAAALLHDPDRRAQVERTAELMLEIADASEAGGEVLEA